MKEAAEAAELRLLEEDDVIDVGIVLENRIGGRFDHPSQVCVGVGFLDRIRNGQSMNHVADRAELDDQNILHALPSFHFLQPAFAMIPVVDLPATRGMKATSPPYASMTRASGSVSRV